MEPRRLPLPPLGANCYLLPNGPQGLVIDPGGTPEAVLSACQRLGFQPAAGDVGGDSGDFTWQKRPAWKPLEDGQTLALAGLELKIFHTPGHSPGSCCFLLEDCLFTGDTLFRFSVGRSDLPGGDAGQLAASLTRLAALPGDYRVFPGHDGPTTLDQEREHNPYLQTLPV